MNNIDQVQRIAVSIAFGGAGLHILGYAPRWVAVTSFFVSTLIIAVGATYNRRRIDTIEPD